MNEKLYKYPRTYHFPWSEGLTSDDKMMPDVSCFDGMDVVMTLKMDGENSTLYRDYYHARSLDSKNHPSRDWIKRFHSEICYNIPEGVRICGENLYARHSISYEDLPSYFLAFSIWEGNLCFSWEFTEQLLELLGIVSVPVLYKGIFSENKIKEVWEKNKNLSGIEQEGYVVRLAGGFYYEDFPLSVAKHVRKNHVQTDNHWMHQKVIPNGIIS